MATRNTLDPINPQNSPAVGRSLVFFFVAPIILRGPFDFYDKHERESSIEPVVTHADTESLPKIVSSVKKSLVHRTINWFFETVCCFWHFGKINKRNSISKSWKIFWKSMRRFGADSDVNEAAPRKSWSTMVKLPSSNNIDLGRFDRNWQMRNI